MAVIANTLRLSRKGAIAFVATFIVLLSVLSITTPTARAAAPSASGSSRTADGAQAQCTRGLLCIWDGFSYTGNELALYYCRFENIGNLGWSDKLRSYINNQTPGTVAKFYNWNGSRWILLGTST